MCNTKDILGKGRQTWKLYNTASLNISLISNVFGIFHSPSCKPSPDIMRATVVLDSVGVPSEERYVLFVMVMTFLLVLTPSSSHGYSEVGIVSSVDTTVFSTGNSNFIFLLLSVVEYAWYVSILVERASKRSFISDQRLSIEWTLREKQKSLKGCLLVSVGSTNLIAKKISFHSGDTNTWC